MNKTMQNRLERLMPAGIPKWIRCYDDGGENIDRYTVVYSKTGRTGSNGSQKIRNGHLYMGMSALPFHPQGVGQHGESDYRPIDKPTYGHLGKKIRFQDLPPDCQQAVLDDYCELWGLAPEAQ